MTDARITAHVLELIAPWVAAQRWYLGTTHTPTLQCLGELRWQDPMGEVGMQTWVLADAGPTDSTVYQVPLTYRTNPLPGAEGALLGQVEHPELGTRYVYDAPHDPVFVQALIDLVVDEGVVSAEDPDRGTARGHHRPGIDAASTGVLTASRVLNGEQSNTSIVVESTLASGEPADPLVIKVFRVLQEGENPDVVLQSVLADAGCTLVPRPVGHLSGTWPLDAADDRLACGHLAFVQEFVRDARDAWREALDAARDGIDFSEGARAIGAATAHVHVTLADAEPTYPFDQQAADRLAHSLLQRLTWAQQHVPALASRASSAAEVLSAVRQSVPTTLLQRVHGDLHLGQILDGGDRGWLVIDFEGEPLRPLAERHQPDLPLRDVAGMLRSFDYAGGHLLMQNQQQATPASAAEQKSVLDWVQTCRDAFCAGYADVTGQDPREQFALLRALELDKALYEVVYEAKHRPDWQPVPLAAVDRLLGDDAPPAPSADHQPTALPVPPQERAELLHGSHGNPHGILGLHPYDGGLTLRTLRPLASEVVAVLPDGSRTPLEHEGDGVFVAVLPGSEVTDYRLDVTYDGDDGTGVTYPVDDPYRFLPTLGDVDLHLIGEGRHEQLWTVLGAHLRRYPGAMGEVSGTSFAVWAPHARGIRLVGDFNHWDGGVHPMRSLGSTGVWELFVPGVGVGARYKYEITGADGHRRLKADPMARATQPPPATASVVTESSHVWGDDAWLAQRAADDPHAAPMSTYEVHLGSWREGLSYRELAEQLVDYVLETGFTHVELMPVMEHPYGPSWGYQVSGYYAPTARFGSPDDFRYLVDRLHQAGIGVLLDWVPAHFPKDAFALARFDGQALYEHADPRRGDQPDWGTHIFDLGRPQVRNFLVANALYWCEEFHIDGLRVDAVASMLYLDYSRKDGEWLPNELGGRENLQAVQFLQETNATVYKRVPGVVLIAEESTAWPGVTRPTHLGGLGFGLKWNMGWMHDSLQYMKVDPMYRSHHHHDITFSIQYAFSESFLLPISHDEVVHGKGSLLAKMPGDQWQKLANVRAYLAFMWAHPGKQLLFMGQEFGQPSEWSEQRGLDWWILDQPVHQGLHRLVGRLNRVYAEQPAFWERDNDPRGFEWLVSDDSDNNVIAFLRWSAGGDPIAVIVNFSGVPVGPYRIGLPRPGEWVEIVNTDAAEYGGSGVGNLGVVTAVDQPWGGQPASVELTIPPLGALYLRPRAS